MRSVPLSHLATTDINTVVGRVLHDLGDPPPPLRLEDVRELLRLDKAFYSSSDDGAIREIAHNLKVAGKQILGRPALLKEVILKFNLRALFLPDRKRILLDSTLPDLKQRWSEAHEIGHDIVPWHADTMLGDDKATLTPACHAEIEAEANFAAGQLLFLRERFLAEARSLAVNLDSIRELKDRYGNTMTTTLWRYIEQSDDILIGAVTCHPHRPPLDFSLSEPIRYLIPSKNFQARFASVSELQIFQLIQSYSRNRNGGPLGSAEIVLNDDNGAQHMFKFETFFNRYDALTLGMHLKPKPFLLSI